MAAAGPATSGRAKGDCILFRNRLMRTQIDPRGLVLQNTFSGGTRPGGGAVDEGGGE